MQSAIADRQIGPGRDDIEVVRLEQRSICGLAHSHPGVAGQQVHHHALVVRIKMLDEDESHAVPGRKGFDELSAGVEAACRRTYPDDQEVVCPCRRTAHRQRRPGQPGMRRFGLRWTPSGHFTWIASGNAPSWNRLVHVITGSLPALPDRQGSGWPNGPSVYVVSESARGDLTSVRVGFAELSKPWADAYPLTCALSDALLVRSCRI